MNWTPSHRGPPRPGSRRPARLQRRESCRSLEPVGRARLRAHGAYRQRRRTQSACCSLACAGRLLSLRSAGCIRRRSGSSARCATSRGCEAEGAPDCAAAGCDHAGAVSVPARRRREPAPDPGRPGARRHHRAGPLPLHRQRRDRGAPGGAARLRAQGHRRAHGRRVARARGVARRARFRRQHGRLRARRSRSAVEAALGATVPPRARLAARARGRARAARQPPRRHRRRLQRRVVQPSCMRAAACCASRCCAPRTPASAIA